MRFSLDEKILQPLARRFISMEGHPQFLNPKPKVGLGGAQDSIAFNLEVPRSWPACSWSKKEHFGPVLPLASYAV